MRNEPDSVRRRAYDVLRSAEVNTGLPAKNLRGLISMPPLSRSEGEVYDYQVVATVADAVMERRQYTNGIVNGFYSNARQGQRGEDTFEGGVKAMLMHGYSRDAISSLPSEASMRFLGLGNVWHGVGAVHGKKVIDVGCGSGVDLGVAGFLSEHSAFVVGLDKRPDLLDVAASACPEASFLIGDVTGLPLAERTFDLVLANGLPPLLRPTTLAATAQALHALAVSGGTISATILVASPTLTSTLAAIFPTEGAAFAGGLAALMSGKPTGQDVVAAFEQAGASAMLRHGTNPYRDCATRQRTALVNLTAIRR